MSDAVSALAGAAVEGIATIREAGLCGMVTLRGDLAAAPFGKAVAEATGLEVPGQGAVTAAEGRALCWMSPDELLLVCDYAEAGAIAARLGTALAGTHHLVANVSDARAVFEVSGKAARDVIAKLTPADVSPAAFAPGRIRRTRLAQAPAAFWMTGADSFRVVCFRSVAGYVFGLLEAAAAPGSEVGFH